MKVLFTIPKNPAPRLEGDQWSKDFKDFIAQCLVKDPDRRATAKELLKHRFIQRAGKVEILRELVERKEMWEAQKEQRAASHPKYYEETMYVPYADCKWQQLTDVAGLTSLPRPKKTHGCSIQFVQALLSPLAKRQSDARWRVYLLQTPLPWRI
jgi:serine/threonine protein kinase